MIAAWQEITQGRYTGQDKPMTRKLIISGFCAILLVLPHALHAQQDVLIKRFSDFATGSFTEKLYLHTDKNDYLAGEIIWWKSYYVDGYMHRPADLSKVIYIELLDNAGKPVLQAKGRLDSTGNDGSFYLPLSLASGSYTIRAYTHWMKNFNADYFFSKQLNVINPLRSAPIAVAQNEKLYDAGFFPEGGDLVAGLESRVGFRVTDQFGTGQNFKGVIINDRKDTILKFTPLAKGIGNFTFTPAQGRTYQALIRLADDQSIVRDLPPARANGYVMHVQGSVEGSILIQVKTGMQSREVSLLAHTRQVFKFYRKEKLQNGLAEFKIERSLLGEGISQFTIFDEDNRAVSERLFFIYPKNHLAIEAGTDNREYGLRKKISLSVQSAVAGKAIPSSLSLSVYRIDSLEVAGGSDINSYLWLDADLGGAVENSASYFDPSVSNRFEAMDNLMLTHGWRRFAWADIVRDTTKVVYQPEFDGHIVTARMLDANSGSPVAGEQVFLGIPGTLTQFYPTRTDQSGHMHFDARDYYGAGDIVIQPDTLLHFQRRIEVANPFSTTLSAKPVAPPILLPETKTEELSKAGFAMQVQNIYSGDSLNNYMVPQLDSMPFYGRHGQIYNLDEYVRFTTMEEVLREYVLEVGIRLRSGKPHLMILDFVNKGFLSQEPLILLDGVLVSHSTILAFDPLKIRKLQVIAARYITGDFVYDGVVSFTTYRRTTEELPTNPSSTILPYDGLQLKREFFSPKYATESQVASRIPDYRNVLYWNPNVLTGNTGTATTSFYSSDLPGKYQVVLEGMDKSGHAGSRSFVIEVKK